MMFDFDEQHKERIEIYKEFVAKEVAPHAIKTDETGEFPYDTVQKMQALGLMGLISPKEYGGSGYDTLTYITCVEEISKACATTGLILSAHTSLCLDPILSYGTEEQKKKYAKPLAEGQMLGAFALTEPGAGTDAQGCVTKAVLEDDEWVINGSKCFITNGKVADVYIVIAITSVSQGKNGEKKNFSAFIVDKDSKGLTFGKKADKMGIRGSATYELIFNDCRIPKENILGPEGKGFGIAMRTLDGGRIGVGAQAIGIAQGALDRTIRYVKERKQFGEPIAVQQNTQFVLAQLATRIEAARMLVYKAAVKKDTNASYSVEASMAKLFATEVAEEVTSKCVQLHGGNGYIREYEVERMMRDAKITQIYEGTSEVQKMVIAGSLLKG